MNILYLANIRIPTEKAHGIQVMKMCDKLSSAGHKVTLLIPKRKTFSVEDIYYYYGLKNHFHIQKVPVLDLVKFGRLGFLLEYISYAIATCWFVIKHPPRSFDLIFSREFLPLTFIPKGPSKIIWESHRGESNFLIKLLMYKVDLLVCISNGLKKFYLEKGYPESKIFVAHDGTDKVDGFVQKIDLRKRFNIPENKKIVLYTGHLYSWKGIATLALATPKEEDAEFVSLFVGGTSKDIYENKKVYADNPNVIFAGRVAHREVAHILASADLLILPTSGESELSREFTSPLKLFEYMESGVPIIASDLPSSKEVLNNDNAYFFEADNSGDLYGKIIFALSDLESSKKVEEAKKDVAKYYWSERVKNILNRLNNNE